MPPPHLFGAKTRKEEDTSSTQRRVVALKVLLFNVWQLPNFLTDGAADRRAQAASRLIARSGADVVLLNEAFLRADAVLSGVRDSHPHRAELGGRAGLFTPLGSGLWVASRLPVASAGGRFFRSRSGADRFASKGVLHARLDLGRLLSSSSGARASSSSTTTAAAASSSSSTSPPPGHPLLDVFVTHMQAGASEAEQLSRARQADEAGAFVREASGGRPFLLAGDLNMSPCPSASVHCATQEDARCRAEAFERLCGRAGMRDAGAPRGAPHEICRFCVGGGDGGVRVRSVRYLGRRCPDTGEVASDTDALLAEVEVVVAAAAEAGG